MMQAGAVVFGRSGPVMVLGKYRFWSFYINQDAWQPLFLAVLDQT